MGGQDEIKEVKVFCFPNAKITVLVPALTEDERNRRMNQIKKAAESLLKSAMAEGGNE